MFQLLIILPENYNLFFDRPISKFIPFYPDYFKTNDITFIILNHIIYLPKDQECIIFIHLQF